MPLALETARSALHHAPDTGSTCRIWLALASTTAPSIICTVSTLALALETSEGPLESMVVIVVKTDKADWFFALNGRHSVQFLRLFFLLCCCKIANDRLAWSSNDARLSKSLLLHVNELLRIDSLHSVVVLLLAGSPRGSCLLPSGQLLGKSSQGFSRTRRLTCSQIKLYKLIRGSRGQVAQKLAVLCVAIHIHTPRACLDHFTRDEGRQFEQHVLASSL